MARSLVSARQLKIRLNLLKMCTGVIKGSEETLVSGQRFLERAAYVELGRGYSTFEGRREELYSIFQWYSRRQGQLKHVDIADRYVPLV